MGCEHTEETYWWTKPVGLVPRLSLSLKLGFPAGKMSKERTMKRKCGYPGWKRGVTNVLFKYSSEYPPFKVVGSFFNI